jgi:cysteine desulfurase
MIYLDYSAHTPCEQEVIECFCKYETQYIGNANSVHKLGKAAKKEIDRISSSIGEMLGAAPEEVIYTSGASESNNLAIKGIARASRHIGKHIITTPLEHSSVSGCLTWLQEQGYEIDLVDIKRDGTVDIENLTELLRSDTVLVAVCCVDSELGTVQPINEIAKILEEYPNCSLHIDATQGIGKIPVCFDKADTMSISAHKFFGLNGSGILLKRKGLVIEPLINGGASTTIYRSGTPTLALDASTECALKCTLDKFQQRLKYVQELNDDLREYFAGFKNVVINSPEKSVPHILNVSVKGVKAVDFQKALDNYGVCVSVKSACSVAGTPSRSVYAVSRDRKNALSSWRISLSHLTTRKEIDEFKSIFERCYREMTK